MSHDLPVKEELLERLDSRRPETDIYACPETLASLSKVTKLIGCVLEEKFVNKESGIKYPIRSGVYDFTVKSSLNKPLWEQTPREIFNTNFFKIPLISAIYERGYRQNFQTAGFPGPEKEFQDAMELFRAANASTVVDLSCGSGFMTRKFIKSGVFSRVIAADYSPTMIQETQRRIRKEKLSAPEIIRCDSARLPFKSDSLDAVHAGAAIHCWPQLSKSLSELYRVLKPNGVVYASTFINFGKSRVLGDNNTPFNYFGSVEVLEKLFCDAGFSGVNGKVVVRMEGTGCAIIKAIKLRHDISKEGDHSESESTGESDDSKESILNKIFGIVC